MGRKHPTTRGHRRHFPKLHRPLFQSNLTAGFDVYSGIYIGPRVRNEALRQFGDRALHPYTAEQVAFIRTVCRIRTSTRPGNSACPAESQ